MKVSIATGRKRVRHNKGHLGDTSSKALRVHMISKFIYACVNEIWQLKKQTNKSKTNN